MSVFVRFNFNAITTCDSIAFTFLICSSCIVIFCCVCSRCCAMYSVLHLCYVFINKQLSTTNPTM